MAVRVPLRVIEFLESPKRVRNWSRVVLAAALMVKSWSSSGPSTDRWTSAGVRLSVSPGFLEFENVGCSGTVRISGYGAVEG